MKERPILFSGPMVRAILEGRKTQTRRIVKVRGGLEYIGPKGCEHEPDSWGYPHPCDDGYLTLADGIKCPYGKPGDRLWVRETWAPAEWPPTGPPAVYRADEGMFASQWKPSIHMPRAVSRITLEVVSVRVERLQDISEEDALAEGITLVERGTSPVDQFNKLWESINGPGSWEANPWVWVVEFKRIEP